VRVLATTAVNRTVERKSMDRLDNRDVRRIVRFEIFRGALMSWSELFRRAADFASGIGPDRMINISHSADHNEGVVTVWYWQ
jgi:hypothetical protein